MTLSSSPSPVFPGRRAWHYYRLDVFTDTPFAGNPLAVFVNAMGMDEATMAYIARELNLSETVFVTQHESAERVHLRIFTPGCELPFAGHPSIGLACLLRTLGNDDRSSMTLVEGVGDVPIRFEGQRAELSAARPLEVTPCPFSASSAARILGLKDDAVAAEPVTASSGVPYHLIELHELDQLAVVDIDTRALKAGCVAAASSALYAWVRIGDRALRTRMFAPLTGTPEDPATGSAAMPLIGYLSALERGRETLEWRIEQGVEMGRPSVIAGRVQRREDGIGDIHIAGQAVIVGDGTFYL